MSSSTPPPLPPPLSPPQPLDSNVQALSDSDSGVPEPPEAEPASNRLNSSPPPLIMYSRAHLLHLSKSPLVTPPPGMPELKDWFGTDTDHSTHKRDLEPTTPNRERRFRRDQEDTDASGRLAFRSTLSQPSQMGNFKHHSIRDREDRDGNERLRNLSDKYDRMNLAAGGLRNKESLSTSGSSGRSANQTQLPALASRRNETRETRRKNGEISEDWRSKGREDRLENGRSNDRAARSPHRDSSRQRRDPSSSRRDDRDSRRRGGAAGGSGGRDANNTNANDDDEHRTWKDDGKREERVAGRRDRERQRDKEGHDSRWTTVEDAKDARGGKRVAREKRGGNEESKESGDRREKEREREKEKQPAWMETYVPSTESSAIVGSQPPGGQLDGIQAWKKGLREKEQQEKVAMKSSPGTQPESATPALDEIQMFKMMMMKEQQKGPTLSEESGLPLEISERKGSELPLASTVAQETPKAPPGINVEPHGVPPPPPGLPNPNSGSPAEFSAPASTSRFFPRPLGNNKLTEAPLEVMGGSEPSRPLSQASNPSSFGFARPNPVPVETLDGSLSVNPIALRGAEIGPPQHQQPHHHQHEELFLASRGVASDVAIELGSQRGSDALGLPMNANESMVPPTEVIKGSRFARFFDANKAKEQQQQQSARPSIPYGPDGRESRPHAIDDIFTMLNSSAQGNRGIPPLNGGNGLLGQMPSQAPSPFVSPLPSQPPHMMATHGGLGGGVGPPPMLSETRLESFYDSRSEDRSFVPDGMVPGLRTAPPPRDRLYAEALEDLRYQGHRIPIQQRNLDPLYGGQGGYAPVAGSSASSSPVGGRSAPPLNQPHFRGMPPPPPPPQILPSGQRFPPGLANLGGRPPHDPSQILASLQQQQQQQQQQQSQQATGFHAHTFASNGGRGQLVGGGLSPGPQQHIGGGGMLPNTMLSGGNHPLDLRLASQQQQQLLALGNHSSMRNAPGGGGGGYGLPQQGGLGHLGRHGGPPGGQMMGVGQPVGGGGMGGPAQDLMALLMGGPRE